MSELPPVAFETSACDLCGGTDAETLFSSPDRLLALPGKFAMVRCRDCGLVRQDPRPTPDTIGFYYPSNYSPYSIAIDDETSTWRRWDRGYGMRKRRIAVDRYQSGGRLLDVGCATGNYLCEMQRTGRWQVEGIEPNPQAAAYARQRFGVTVHVGQLTHLNLPSANYDAITMWNVLEHVHYPTANLREAYRLLRAGGFLYFAVPVVTGRLRQWFGPYWAEWDLPRHTYIFSQKAVEKFTQAVGFQLIAAIANFSDFRVFHMSLVNWAHEHIAGARWRSFLESVPRFLPVRVILVLTLRVVAPAHANSVLTFVCQK